ncbi:hypothetical protein GCM10009639_70490 [Kitasatospora putterlickiae]|uniref:ABC3 transporter permease C-terminal domain-containing protein n=1 Tax=Kitasatospora putterlickiae TaxID=221725 RepID=A0ABP4J989_9ACTN
MLAALPASDRDRAAHTVGADLRLSGVSGPPARQHGALAALPGVTGLTPVAEKSVFVGSSVVQTVALDSAAASAAGLPSLRQDLADRPAPALLAPLTAVPAHGIAVPGEPTALEVTVTASADRPLPEPGPELLLWIQDANGLTEQLAVPLPADGRPHTVTVPLAGGERRAHPLTLGRLGVDFTDRQRARTTLDLRLTRIGAVTDGQRTDLALPPGWSWARADPAPVDPAALGCPGTETAPGDTGVPGARGEYADACGWEGGGADLLHAVLRSHDPLSGATRQSVALTVRPGPGTGAPVLPVLPALADRALLDAVRAKAGDTVELDWDRDGGGVQKVLITGVVDGLPGYDRTHGHLLLDLRAVAANRALTGAPPPTATRWWLTSDDPAATRAAVAVDGRFGRPQSAPEVAAALADDPFRTGLRCAWLLVLVTAPLFAVTALTLHTVSAVRSRQREFAVLRALGVRTGELTALLRAEQVAVTVPPVLLGGALGLLLAALLPAFTVLDDRAGPVFPALATAPGRPATVLTALAAGLLLALAVLVLTRLLARVDLVRALRAGEDG